MALDIDIRKYLYIYTYLNLSLAPLGVTPPSAPPFFWPFLVRQTGGTVSAREGPRGAQLRRAEKPVAPRGIPLRRRGRPSFRRGRNGVQTRGAAPEKKRRGAGGRKKISSRAGLPGTRVCSSPQKMINMATEKPPLAAFLREYGVALSPGLVLDCGILIPSVSP